MKKENSLNVEQITAWRKSDKGRGKRRKTVEYVHPPETTITYAEQIRSPHSGFRGKGGERERGKFQLIPNDFTGDEKLETAMSFLQRVIRSMAQKPPPPTPARIDSGFCAKLKLAFSSVAFSFVDS